MCYVYIEQISPYCIIYIVFVGQWVPGPLQLAENYIVKDGKSESQHVERGRSFISIQMFHTHTPAGADCSWGHPLRRCCGNRTSSVIVAALRGTTYGRGKRISDFLDPWGATSLGMPGPLFDQKMIYPFSFAGPLDKDCFLDAGTCCLTWRIFFTSLSLSPSPSRFKSFCELQVWWTFHHGKWSGWTCLKHRYSHWGPTICRRSFLGETLFFSKLVETVVLIRS